jgi:phosphohistidine phosphatase
MNLYVIRHATAVPRSPNFEDASRPLTPQGQRRFARVVRGLERLGVDFDRLYHSPWLRAVETAEALTALVRGESVSLPALAQPPQPSLFEQLRGDDVGVVGHEPWLSELVALATLARTDDAGRFPIKKGGVVWLTGEMRPGGMVLHALFPPRALRAIGVRKRR